MLIVGLFYLLFPTFMLALFAFKKQPNRLSWFVSMLLTGVSILFIWTIARWELVSVYFRPLFPILYLIAIWYSYSRINSNAMSSRKIYFFNLSINAIMLFVISVFCFLSLRGYRVPTQTVEMQSPLRDGEFILLHGGSRPMINAHFHVTPQNYAIDLVALDALGRRANSIAGGPILSDYHIYGMPVYSPCEGKVLIAIDKFEDLIPPLVDKKNIAGNHLLIQCNDKEVLLAHLQKSSLLVKVGDKVSTDTQLARVGNTGNSSEPHLHMHVETGGKAATILNGKGVAFKINHKFLVRGDSI